MARISEDESKKRLGRGLASLIGEIDPPGTSWHGGPQMRADRKVAVEHIRANANNPRRRFEEEDLEDLARSIAEHGIVQPILVRSAPDGVQGSAGGARFEIIAGERRWRAAQKAGLHEVPVIVREVDDRQALELAIIENVQRSDLNSLEEAAGYQQLITDHSYTQADLGKVIGKSRSHVANTLRLLKLPASVKAMIGAGELSAGHARTLITAPDPEALARDIVEKGLSVRQAENLAQRQGNPEGTEKPRPAAGAAQGNADIKALETGLEDSLGLKVSINYRENGSGDIRISYKSLDQLDLVCGRLR